MLVRHRTIDPKSDGRAFLILLKEYKETGQLPSTLRNGRRIFEDNLFPLFLRVHPNKLFSTLVAWEVLLDEKIYLVAAKYVRLWDPSTDFEEVVEIS